MEKLNIGISIGDINGIGLEVIIKTISEPRILNLCTPVIYGSAKVLSYHKNITELEFPFHQVRDGEKFQPNIVNVVNCWQESVNINLGQITEDGGIYAIKSLAGAVKELKEGQIDGLVTAPIHKEAMLLAKFGFPGHTEYLTHAFGQIESLMFLTQDNLRVGLVTNHLPLSKVSSSITKNLIIKKINLMESSLQKDFGIDKPIIAILGLNPHAGDGGAIGDEEELIIRPAVIECKKNGTLAFGPFAADGFFGSGNYAKYDAILSMYHDQGLIPFKLLAFGGGTNFTAGLPFVRTSPDHGTAFEIAGKNIADPSSFRTALFSCIDLVRSRTQFHLDHENPLVRRHKASIQNPASNEEEEIIEDLD